MKRVKGQPITASNTAMRSKPPVLSDANDTSRDAQKQIKQPPQPFANPMGAKQAPTGIGPKGAVPGPVRKPHAGLQHSSPGIKALPSGGPVGQRKAINQSGQIGGRKGFPPPKRKAGSQNLSSVKRNASFYGEN